MWHERSSVKTNVSEQDGNKVRLDIELSAEEVQRAIDATVNQLAKDVRLPGFRKGKVPRDLVVQRFGMHAIIHQTLDDYLGSWYGRAVVISGIQPVDRPEVNYDEDPEPGKEFAFRADVEVMPKAELGEYKGLKVPKEQPVVEDAEVDSQVDRLRREFGELRSVTGRPAQEEDYVTVDFTGVVDGKPVENASVEDYQYQLGTGQFLEDLEEGIAGMTVDEERHIPVRFPDDYASSELAGKTADFTVRLKDLKELSLPALNDEFAKDASEFATLLELRLDIRRKLQGIKEAATRRRYRSEALALAADNATIELPESAIEEQAHEMLEDFARSIQAQGTEFPKYLEASGATVEGMLASLRPGAENTVKTGAVLDAVAEAEGLAVDDEELFERIKSMAGQAGVEPVEFRSRLEESGRMTTVRRQLVREKAADLIVDSAVPTAPPVEPESPVDEGPEAQAIGDEGDDEGRQSGETPVSEDESTVSEKA
jgi:trigger factor